MRQVLFIVLLAVSLAMSACSTRDQNAAGEDPNPSPPGAATGVEPTPTETPGDEVATAAVPSETRRVVAIGDVHGDLAATKAALKVAGVLGEDDGWTGGNAVLVQTGDLLDRGDDEPEILALFEALQREAPESGGEVVLLNGNHELMNALGDLRYVTPNGFEDYAAVAADHLPGVAEIPEYARGRVAAFAPGGEIARKLAKRGVVAVVERTVFAHGGILPAYAKKGADALNEEVEGWLAGHKPVPALVTAQDGPVWSRHFSDDTDAADCELLGEALAALDADRMVVGHTPQMSGITSACDGRVWRIDTGMAKHYGGSVQALQIRGDEVTILK